MTPTPTIELRDDHRYFLGPHEYISVTAALDENGYGSWKRFVDPIVLEYACALGTATHDAIALLLAGELDESSIDPAIRGRLRGFERFVREHDLFAMAVEQPVFNSIYRYAGKPDFVGLLDEDQSILDWKSAVVNSSVAMQLAGYCGCFAEPATYRRFSVQLRDNGTYRLHEYFIRDFREDWYDFLACVRVAMRKRRDGVR